MIFVDVIGIEPLQSKMMYVPSGAADGADSAESSASSVQAETLAGDRLSRFRPFVLPGNKKQAAQQKMSEKLESQRGVMPRYYSYEHELPARRPYRFEHSGSPLNVQ